MLPVVRALWEGMSAVVRQRSAQTCESISRSVLRLPITGTRDAYVWAYIAAGSARLVGRDVGGRPSAQCTDL